MALSSLEPILTSEIERLTLSGASKRREIIIDGFTPGRHPKALISDKKYLVFNSNDYLGLRFYPALKEAEKLASRQYGTGPGAVRFISGTLRIYTELESRLAAFHHREAAMVFSSAFAANLAVLFCLIRGQSKDTLVSGNTLVVSDELNHRSIVEGIRVANLDPTQKQIYHHLDFADLDRILSENLHNFNRVLVVTDGVFSMLGEQTNLAALREVICRYESGFPEGIILVVDDCHGIGAVGITGRGVEEVFSSPADVLIGTLGKSFGCDGGYVVGSQILIDYLRESAATYIYSNPVSPGTAAAAKAAVDLVDSPAGINLLKTLSQNINHFKAHMLSKGFHFAADSSHPIQPLFVGDTGKTVELKKQLFDSGILVTNINYPVVAKGKDEIRIQISASHRQSDLNSLIKTCSRLKTSLSL